MRLIRAALRELTDLELAYFAIYTSPKLTPDTREKIWNYLDERNLNKIKAKALIELHECKPKEHEGPQCPRCHTQHTAISVQAISSTPTWLTYSDLVAIQSKNQRTHWPVEPKKCVICETPVNQSPLPQPPVQGVRVFTNSLRS